MNKSDLHLETHRKTLEFYYETGKHPRFLYLGKQEFKALEKLAESVCNFECKLKGGEFIGLQVFKVDVESHFRVN